MNRKILIRLLVILVAVVTFVSIASVMYFNRINSKVFHDYLENSISNSVHFASLAYSKPLWNLDETAIRQVNEALFDNKAIMAVNVFTDTEFLNAVKRKSLTSSSKNITFLEQPYNADSHSIIKKVSSEIFFDNKKVGHFEMFYTEYFVEQAIRQASIRMILSFIAIGLTIILIIFIALNSSTIRPILNLAKISREIASTENYSLRVHKTRDDEIGELYDGFNNMLDQIHKREMERDKKEEQLRQAQKMETVGTLAGGLAHDFNNMLGGIMGALSIIRFKQHKSGGITNEDLERNLSIMESAGNRATDMVRQLLTISRKYEEHYVCMDINESLENIINVCASTFDKSIEIIPKPYEKKALINADPTQIEQVLLNLCINASHSMTIMRNPDEKYGGVLNIAIDRIDADRHFCSTHPEAIEGFYLKIMVQDTGVGMDSRILSKIFDPFFTTKEKGKGTGLGMAVVYNIVKQHKGFIDVYSEPGNGTAVYVYLPESVQDESLKGVRKQDMMPRGEGLVLVVDDEEMMRHVAQSILMECGYKVLPCNDGQEALDLFRQRYADIKAVLLDMVMPNKSGKEVYYEMKKIDPKVKVLLTSGFRMDERVEAVMNDGAKGFVEKPYTMARLSTAIHDVIYS